MGYPYGSWIVKFSASNPTYITQTFNTQSNQFYLISMNVRNTFTGTKNYNSPKTLFVRITSGGNVLELGMLWTFRDTIIRSNAEFQFAQDIRDDGMQQASIYAHIFVTPQGIKF